MQPATRGLAPLDTRVVYQQKGYAQAPAPRPISNATEMFDTDFEDDDNNSDIDDDEEYSPRISLNSVRVSRIDVDNN